MIDVPETRYAKSGSVNIAYQVVGDGAFDLVHVPPFVSNLELQWEDPTERRYFERLASFSRLILFDKRGTGLSDRVAVATLEERMDDLRAVMDAAGSERAVVYGSSEGGALSILFAATLVLHRTADLSHATGSRYLGAHIPGAKVVELQGDEYFPHLGDQDAILDEIEEFLTGVRPVHAADRALATVLFTAIVSSTQRAAVLGDDEWTRILDQHDFLAAREVDRHRGRRVKTIGDGMLATFDGPARAVRCAQAICTGVRSLGVEVRAGLHTGEIELRGDDIGGFGRSVQKFCAALRFAFADQRRVEPSISENATTLIAPHRTA